MAAEVVELVILVPLEGLVGQRADLPVVLVAVAEPQTMLAVVAVARSRMEPLVFLMPLQMETAATAVAVQAILLPELLSPMAVVVVVAIPVQVQMALAAVREQPEHTTVAQLALMPLLAAVVAVVMAVASPATVVPVL